MDETGHSGDTGTAESGTGADSRDRALLNGWARPDSPWSNAGSALDPEEEDDDVPAWRRPGQEIRPFTRQNYPPERPSGEIRPFSEQTASGEVRPFGAVIPLLVRRRAHHESEPVHLRRGPSLERVLLRRSAVQRVLVRGGRVERVFVRDAEVVRRATRTRPGRSRQRVLVRGGLLAERYSSGSRPRARTRRGRSTGRSRRPRRRARSACRAGRTAARGTPTSSTTCRRTATSRPAPRRSPRAPTRCRTIAGRRSARSTPRRRAAPRRIRTRVTWTTPRAARRHRRWASSARRSRSSGPPGRFPAVRPATPGGRRVDWNTAESARHALEPNTPPDGPSRIDQPDASAEAARVRSSYDPVTFPRRLPNDPGPSAGSAPPADTTTGYAAPTAYSGFTGRSVGDPGATPIGEQISRALPQRVPAEPDVPTVPEPPSVEPSAETPALARIATHLRRGDVLSAEERQEGFDVKAILAAVREVEGVRDASLRSTPAGAHSLRLDLAEGADPAEVSRQVARLLQDRMGLDAAMQGWRGRPAAARSGLVATRLRRRRSTRRRSPHSCRPRPGLRAAPRWSAAGRWRRRATTCAGCRRRRTPGVPRSRCRPTTRLPRLPSRPRRRSSRRPPRR